MSIIDNNLNGMEESSNLLAVVASLRGSLISRNENFDASVKGDQLRFDLMFRWMRCSCNTSRPDISLTWFERILQYHSDPNRHYHTLMHLEEIFLYFDLVKDHYKDSQGKPMTAFDEDSIVLSTFFHDAIYDVRSSTNEEDSAALFEEFMRELVANGVEVRRGLRQFVVECILATKKHDIAADNPPCMSLFLDLDLAVLGKETPAYFIYASLIRKEYNYVPHEVYCEKRADILEEFLQQPQIFATQAMMEAFEQRARDNLAREVESLRRGKIPDGNSIQN